MSQVFMNVKHACMRQACTGAWAQH